VKEFLASGFDWLLMIDNDMRPPHNLLDMLDRAGSGMNILVPKFFVFSLQVKHCARNPRLPLTLMWNCLTPPDKREWCELDSAGTGVMFIHRHVFERLGNAPPFRFRYDESGMILEGEDLVFCHKARAAGFSIWGNQAFEADHFKTVSLSALAQTMGAVIPSLSEAKA